MSIQNKSTGRSAIATGSSRGIGAAIAQRLARDGWRSSSSIRATPARPTTSCSTAPASCNLQLATLADCDDKLFQRHIAINLKGTFFLLRAAAAHLRNGGRDIANVAACLAGPDGGWVNGQVVRVNGGVIR